MCVCVCCVCVGGCACLSSSSKDSLSVSIMEREIWLVSTCTYMIVMCMQQVVLHYFC